jgi:hypothetical protein
MEEHSVLCPQKPTSQHPTLFISQRFSFPPVYIDEQDERARPDSFGVVNFFVCIIIIIIIIIRPTVSPFGFVLFSVCLK